MQVAVRPYPRIRSAEIDHSKCFVCHQHIASDEPRYVLKNGSMHEKCVPAEFVPLIRVLGYTPTKEEDNEPG